jgi:hypothetical protein
VHGQQPGAWPASHTYNDEQLRRFAAIMGETAGKVDYRVRTQGDVVDALVEMFVALNGRLRRLESLELEERRRRALRDAGQTAAGRRFSVR